jgi:hypothetical protein
LAYFKSVVDELSSLASIEAGERTPSESRQIISRLQQLGARLWDELLPADFKKEYQARLRQEYQGKSLVITSDEPWIPWEMVRPFELGPGGRPLYSDRPLCEQFMLTRWLSGNGAPDRLSVMRVVTIAPVDNLQSVEEEVAFFREISQREARIKWIGPLLTLDDVDEELAEGTAQAFHFSCHGNFRYEDADESMLQFGDGFLRPSNIRFMEQIALWKSAPLVFVNACHSGQTGFTLTRMGPGEAFLGGSEYVHRLTWEINDSSRPPAREFYTGFSSFCLPAQTIGEAFPRPSSNKTKRTNLAGLCPLHDPNGRVEFAGMRCSSHNSLP